MFDAIIGATGFVGTNLRASHHFEAQFNSKNIADIEGQSFSTVVCAAAPAKMWAANRDPEGDLANIRALVTRLSTFRADRFVLVSTIAVLADAAGGDDETTDRFENDKAYGRNRRFLEEACIDLFPRCHVLRLPALYGAALKKNFVFDLINPIPSFLNREKFAELDTALPAVAREVMASVFVLRDDLGMYACHRDRLDAERRRLLTDALFAYGFTALDFTHADSSFQYYGLGRLWMDIGVVLDADIPVAHLAPAPLRAGDVARALTGRPFDTRSAAPYHEDMRTRHAAAWGRTGSYLLDSTAVLADLAAFHAEAIRA